MLSGLVVTALLMLAVLIVVFLYIDNKNKQKARQLRIRQTEQANAAKSRYKVDVSGIAESMELSVEARSKLLIISNNFFVYQPVNEASLSALVYNLDKLSHLLSALHEDFIALGEESKAADKIDCFVDGLPKSARGYNAAFYDGNLAVLCQLLVITDSTSDNEVSAVEPVEVNRLDVA